MLRVFGCRNLVLGFKVVRVKNKKKTLGLERRVLVSGTEGGGESNQAKNRTERAGNKGLGLELGLGLGLGLWSELG